MTLWYPKRSPARWREGAPHWVCDAFDDMREDDRFTIFLTGSGWISELDPRATYIGCDDNGRCHLGDLPPMAFARYRRRNAKHRVAWLNIRADIRNAIVDYAMSC